VEAPPEWSSTRALMCCVFWSAPTRITSNFCGGDELASKRNRPSRVSSE
jgi:hypothetical protein